MAVSLSAQRPKTSAQLPGGTGNCNGLRDPNTRLLRKLLAEPVSAAGTSRRGQCGVEGGPALRTYTSQTLVGYH
ncbi:hypothetical protein NUW54_g4383 [Trametes sanguinea]|uniref:Uncharacterized protein n=1 Tax=Trametes sanguinea TaxID=158606 RepID=A0ACC1PZR5_9APHY|nr:hypothetical protein NUW54_g4383 [Trametes sanguinea]